MEHPDSLVTSKSFTKTVFENKYFSGRILALKIIIYILALTLNKMKQYPKTSITLTIRRLKATDNFFHTRTDDLRA
jgi:hypothetical protein